MRAMSDWRRWRREFPITERLLHLNHAGISPIPRRVAAAVKAFADEAMVVERSIQKRWEARGEEVRAAFARLVGARPEEIAFVKNTSEGLSLVAAGLDWRDGDNVVAVDGEYPSNVYPWFGLRGHGVETRLVQSRNGMVGADDIAAAADGRTRVAAVSFVDWQRGGRNDLASIASFCRQRGILLCVDGIQGVGAIRLDVELQGVDCLAVGGHKWMLAPEGVGCLYISARLLERVHSVLHGWKSVTDADTYLPYHFHPRPDAARFEPGSPPQLGVQALGAALDLLLEVGPQAVEERVLALTRSIGEELRRRGADILSPWGDDLLRSGIITFRRGDPQALLARLSASGIVARPRAGGVRVSPHFYNDEDDVARLAEAVGGK